MVGGSIFLEGKEFHMVWLEHLHMYIYGPTCKVGLDSVTISEFAVYHDPFFDPFSNPFCVLVLSTSMVPFQRRCNTVTCMNEYSNDKKLRF